MEGYRKAGLVLFVVIWVWMLRALVVLFDHGNLFDQTIGCLLLLFWTGLTAYSFNDGI